MVTITVKIHCFPFVMLTMLIKAFLVVKSKSLSYKRDTEVISLCYENKDQDMF